MLPLAALFALTAGVVALSAPATRGSGIDAGQAAASLATAFAHLYVLQARQLHRPDVTEAQLRTTASCDKGDGLVAQERTGQRLALHGDLAPARCQQADRAGNLPARCHRETVGTSPTATDRVQVNGYFLVRTPAGDAANPLWQFDGTVDLLAHPKG